MKNTILSLVLVALGGYLVAQVPAGRAAQGAAAKPVLKQQPEVFNGKKVVHSAVEWRRQLSADAYEVSREKGTERPGSSSLLDNHEKGIYYCVGCALPLFRSEAKFDSGTGWPSFYQPIYKNNISTATDIDLGVERTEVMCARCDAHLGHVFNDGPEPTGLRYCMNGVALRFAKY